MKLCKCGCGLEIKEFDSRGREIKFIKYHNNKGINHPMYNRSKPKNLCKCGCGKEVKNNRNLYFPGHFTGFRGQNGKYIKNKEKR